MSTASCKISEVNSCIKEKEKEKERMNWFFLKFSCKSDLLIFWNGYCFSYDLNLLHQVDTFFAVGSPLGVFLALRNIRIGIGKSQ